MVVEGMPTVTPFHRAVLDDPAFVAADGHFGVHTRWIETEFSGAIEPYAGVTEEPAPIEERSKVVVGGERKRMEVVVPSGAGAGNGVATAGWPASGAAVGWRDGEGPIGNA